MNIHKRTRLTPLDRQEIWKLYSTRTIKVNDLAEKYRVSRQTISKIITRCRKQEFNPRKSTNKRYRSLKYGLKRLAKIESSIEIKRKNRARRYNKSYPGEMIHFDTKRLPLIKGQTNKSKRQYLFVGIDDFSRELYAEIMPDKTQFSSTKFLLDTIEQCPYTLECSYSDNGTEYKGTDSHEFVKACKDNGLGQKFTRVKRPQTNGKAERVIRTLMEMWHQKIEFKSEEHRKKELNRFINYYNTVKPHKGIGDKTPYEKLEDYFYLDEDVKSGNALNTTMQILCAGM
jgi:transposase-like protein